MFELGGEKIANNRLQIDDTVNTDYGMLVGLDYFRSHRIYVSRLQRQVYDTRDAALPQDVAQDDADTLARRGAASIAARDYQRALQDLNRACGLAPGVADCFYLREQLHMAMRQSRPALTDLDEALRLDPALAEARIRRARVRVGLGDGLGAQADLMQLDAALRPSSPLRADMAELHARSDQASEVLRQFDLWVSTHQKRSEGRRC